MSKAIPIILGLGIAFVAVPFCYQAWVTSKKAPASGDAASEAPALPPTPQVVSLSPANGAKDVDPGLGQLTVTFERPMGSGYSWTGGGEMYPETTGAPVWSNGNRTCSLPVRLAPNKAYRLGLNSKSHQNFKSSGGAALAPLVWEFRTGG